MYVLGKAMERLSCRIIESRTESGAYLYLVLSKVRFEPQAPLHHLFSLFLKGIGGPRKGPVSCVITYPSTSREAYIVAYLSTKLMLYN